MSSIEKEIREKLDNLGSIEFCYPIDIFSISNQIEEKLYPNDVVDNLIQEYGQHQNAFVRRAILTAIRFIGSKFAEKHISLVQQGLKDKDDWVVYDSAWILSNMKVIAEDNIELLKKVAGNLVTLSNEELEKFQPDKAHEYSSKKAAEALLNNVKI